MHTMRIASRSCSNRRCRQSGPGANQAPNPLATCGPPCSAASTPSRQRAAGALRRDWFDWALLAGLVVFAASFPATIPVFLYYL